MTPYVDLQVNGFAGVDFNSDELSLQCIISACEALVADGAGSILATVITASQEKMLSRIETLALAIERSPDVANLIAGIHVEGPFISPVDGFVGAHPVNDVVPASIDTAARLLEAGQGHVRLLTLAPECDRDAATTRFLTDRGIVVAAGHSDASLDDLDRSIDAGLRLFTHLGNGCPAQLHRHDNIIQRVLSRSHALAVSFIADGHHVPAFALQNYLDVMPADNVVIVSDAISAAGLGAGDHRLSDQTVHVDEDLAAWSADRTHFAGSATSVGRMRQILRVGMGRDDDFVRKVTVDNPMRLLA